ncbi:hypothetical protein Celaphus_00015147 [Cervus elaphus hippelaphus]|uniref:Uncharacterized protein n=1 Tax=Cervus elaphus hippelaphus TaxID=46360 RepID=A0A212CRZ7_CEREH|nr:hypothetical protein Celaphus_00015147 [Cervus elaphus hippelaphus]
MKVNFLKPNLKVNLWKSDSSLETMENASVMDNKAQAESDGEMSSDNDSYHSDEFHTNSKSDEDRQLANSSASVGTVDYFFLMVVTITHECGLGKGQESSLKKGPSADIIYTLTGFGKPVDICCHGSVQDAQNKIIRLSETRSVSQQDRKKRNQMTNQVSHEEIQSNQWKQIPSPPSQLDVSFSATGPQFVSVELGQSVVSQKTTSSKSSMLELETGLHVANITQAGLTQGIKFAVANVQKSPAEPEVVKEVQQNELKNIFTQCQTRDRKQSAQGIWDAECVTAVQKA